MIALMPHDQQALINIVLDYVRGAPLDTIDSRIKQACNTHQQSAKKLYQQTMMNIHTRYELLNILHVRNHPAFNKNTNLFELLTELHDDQVAHNHLAYLLKRIQTIDHSNNQSKALRVTGVVAGVLGLFLVKESVHKINQVTQPLFNSILNISQQSMLFLLRHIPLVGIMYTSVTWVVHTYKTFYYGFHHLSDKMLKLCFHSLSKALTISGYCISILAACIATPTVGLLSMASAMVDVIESWVNYTNISKKPLNTGMTADTIRQMMEKKHASQTIGIKFCSGLLGVVIVGIWCFCPPSMLLSIMCVAAMILNSMLKSIALKHIEHQCAEQLQQSLQANQHRFFQPARAANTPYPKADDISSLVEPPVLATGQ